MTKKNKKLGNRSVKVPQPTMKALRPGSKTFYLIFWKLIWMMIFLMRWNWIVLQRITYQQVSLLNLQQPSRLGSEPTKTAFERFFWSTKVGLGKTCLNLGNKKTRRAASKTRRHSFVNFSIIWLE